MAFVLAEFILRTIFLMLPFFKFWYSAALPTPIPIPSKAIPVFDFIIYITPSKYDGIIIKLSSLDNIEISDTKITVGAGYQLIKLSLLTAKRGLTGLEFASGIPGTVGGAVFMNAGAYGSEMKDLVIKTRYLTYDGKIKTYNNKNWRYKRGW